MTGWDRLLALLCVAWLLALGVLTASASPRILAALRREDAADWAAASATFAAVLVALAVATLELTRSRKAEEQRVKERDDMRARDAWANSTVIVAEARLAAKISQQGRWSIMLVERIQDTLAVSMERMRRIELGMLPTSEWPPAVATMTASAQALHALAETLKPVLREKGQIPEDIFDQTAEKVEGFYSRIEGLARARNIEW